jgi:D-ribose pyranose/furanose isomerase RbsD
MENIICDQHSNMDIAMNNNFRGVCHNLTKYVSNIIVQKMQVASQVLDVNNNLMMTLR